MAMRGAMVAKSDVLVSAEEAAVRLSVSRARLYQLVRHGLVPAVRLGRAVRFSPAALDAFVADGGRRQGREGEGHKRGRPALTRR